MKKMIRVLCILQAVVLLFAVPAFATEDGAAEPASFDVNIFVNGDEYATASIGAEVEENVYSFNILALLDVFGFDMTYDEQTDTASVTARDGTVAAVLFSDFEGYSSDGEAAAAAAVDEVREQTYEEPPVVGSRVTVASFTGKNVPKAMEAVREKHALRAAAVKSLPDSRAPYIKKNAGHASPEVRRPDARASVVKMAAPKADVQPKQAELRVVNVKSALQRPISVKNVPTAMPAEKRRSAG